MSSSGDIASTFLVDGFLGTRFFPLTVAVAAEEGCGREAEMTVRVTERLRRLKGLMGGFLLLSSSLLGSGV